MIVAHINVVVHFDIDLHLLLLCMYFRTLHVIWRVPSPVTAAGRHFMRPNNAVTLESHETLFDT